MTETLKKLHKRMIGTNWFLHPFRNNPRFTVFYYNYLIDAPGLDIYQKSTYAKIEWDAAKFSFDKMYGLVAAWKNNPPRFDDEVNNVALKQSTDELLSALLYLNGSIELNEKEIYDSIAKYDDFKKHLDSYTDLKYESTALCEKIQSIDPNKLDKKLELASELTKLCLKKIGFSK